MNGRERPGPEWGICPTCGRKVGLRIDGTLADHTPTGDPYSKGCVGSRPDNTRLRAVVRGGLGVFVLAVTLGLAVFADRAPQQLTVDYTPDTTVGVGE